MDLNIIQFVYFDTDFDPSYFSKIIIILQILHSNVNLDHNGMLI